MMRWESLREWFMGLGQEYGVNPIIFGAIYVGAIPFFLASVAWLARNAKMGRPVILPTFLTGFFFISAYLYLIVAGRNVPWWVYAFIILLVGFTGFSTMKKIRRKIRDVHNNTQLADKVPSEK